MCGGSWRSLHALGAFFLQPAGREWSFSRLDSTSKPKARPTKGDTLHARLRLGYRQHQVMAQESDDDWHSIRPPTELGEKFRRRKTIEPADTISKIYPQATAPWGLSTAPCDYQSGAFRSSTTTAGLDNLRPPFVVTGCAAVFHTKGMTMCSERASSASAITLGAQARPRSEIRGANNYWHVKKKPPPRWCLSCCV